MDDRYLVFRYRNASYAIEAGAVQEIAWLPELSPVVEGPAAVVGAFNLRGHVVTVVDLGRCFGQGLSSLHVTDAVIVVEAQEERFAILANDVIDLVSIAPEDIEDVSRHHELLGPSAHLLQGVALSGERLAMVVDLASLLGEAARRDSLRDVRPGSGDGADACDAGADADAFRMRARHMATPQRDDGADSELFALADLGAELVGIPVHYVREFMRPGTIWPVPCCPEHILGVANRKGDIMTLIDLRPLMGLKSQAPLTQVVVVQAAGATVGIGVSEVIDVIGTDTLAPLQLAANDDEKNFWCAKGRAGDRIFSILDIEDLIASRVLHVSEEQQPGIRHDRQHSNMRGRHDESHLES